MGLHLKTGFKEREDEQICLKASHSPSRILYGKALAEVLSMSYIGEGDPSGTINVYDGKRGQIIYKKSGRTDKRASRKHSNSTAQKENDGLRLSLTGPYRAISMDGCAVIEFNQDDGCHAEILLDIDDPSTKYDDTMTKKLNCMCHDRPIAMVTYAILSNAVEANLEVKLLQRLDDTFYGRIVAQSYLGEVVLFESNNENTFGGSCQKPTIIPLSRSVLAVPLGSSLHIEVDLRNHSNGKIMKGFMKCQADLNSDRVLRLDGENGQVELKITWSD